MIICPLLKFTNKHIKHKIHYSLDRSTYKIENLLQIKNQNITDFFIFMLTKSD